MDAMVAIFRADARLEDCGDISRDRELPTADQCPALRVRRLRALREPLTIGHGLIGNEKLTPIFQVDCIAFSGESTFDAERQADALTNKTEAVLRENLTLGGRVKVVRITATEFDTAPAQSGGIFAINSLVLEALQLL